MYCPILIFHGSVPCPAMCPNSYVYPLALSIPTSVLSDALLLWFSTLYCHAASLSERPFTWFSTLYCHVSPPFFFSWDHEFSLIGPSHSTAPCTAMCRRSSHWLGTISPCRDHLPGSPSIASNPSYLILGGCASLCRRLAPEPRVWALRAGTSTSDRESHGTWSRMRT